MTSECEHWVKLLSNSTFFVVYSWLTIEYDTFVFHSHSVLLFHFEQSIRRIGCCRNSCTCICVFEVYLYICGLTRVYIVCCIDQFSATSECARWKIFSCISKACLPSPRNIRHTQCNILLPSPQCLLTLKVSFILRTLHCYSTTCKYSAGVLQV